jgi:hypothetical protein
MDSSGDSEVMRSSTAPPMCPVAPILRYSVLPYDRIISEATYRNTFAMICVSDGLTLRKDVFGGMWKSVLREMRDDIFLQDL